MAYGKSLEMFILTSILWNIPSVFSLRDTISPTGTLLKGPSNQTLHLDQTVRFQCRVHDRPVHEMGSNSVKHLTVQWIINGFGVTNETLRAVYDSRYRMPGPAERGIYDLEISNVRLEDEASLLCQADVRVEQTNKKSVVETLASQPAQLTVIVPPARLYMKTLQSNPISTHRLSSHHFSSQLDSSSTSHIVADDPESHSGKRTASSSFDQTVNYQHLEKPFLPTASPSSFPLWIPEGDKVFVECRSTHAKPAPKLAWFLSGSPLRRGQMMSTFRQQQIEEFEISEEQISNLSRFNQSEEEPRTLVTLSVLQLLVRRHHQNQQLECRVENSAEFLTNSLPTVAAIIQPIYVDKVRIEMPASPGGHVREGSIVQFLCTANMNPAQALYNWALIDHSQYKNSTDLSRSLGPFPRPSSLESNQKSLVGERENPGSIKLTMSRQMHRSFLRCWVGVKSPEVQSIGDDKQLWAYSEIRLDILYGPTFLQTAQNILAGFVGETIYVDCLTDSNPPAQVSLYLLGEEGQSLLTQMGEREFEGRQKTNGGGDDTPMSSEYSQVANALKVDGTKLLASNTQRLNHPVHMHQEKDFGFYVCVARSTGFSATFRHVYIGKSSPPTIIRLVQQDVPSQPNAVVIKCIIRSIPRPKRENIVWLRNNLPVQSSNRIFTDVEDLTFGLVSTLRIRRVEPNDMSVYNCSVSNEYGTTWESIVLTEAGKFPLMFLVGSGGAALLAVIFMIMLCCFIRHVRKRAHGSIKRGAQNHITSNGQWPNDSTLIKSANEYELHPMLGSVRNDAQLGFLRYDSIDSQSCQLCYVNTSADPTLLPSAYPIETPMTEMQVDVADSGFQNSNCKRSDDSGVETGPNVGSDTSQNSIPPWTNTFVFHQPPSLVTRLQSLSRPTLNSESFVKPVQSFCSYPNRPSASSSPVPTSTSGTHLIGLQQYQNQPRSFSPIVLLTPQHQSLKDGGEIYANPMVSPNSSMIVPSVVVSSRMVTSLHEDPLSFQAPCISPDLSVLPLQFLDYIPVSCEDNSFIQINTVTDDVGVGEDSKV